MVQRFYGCKPDDPARAGQDPKFRLPWFGAASRFMPESWLPQEIDLFPWFPPVMNQGPAGTCTVHASTTAVRYNLINAGTGDVPLSRLQLYWDAGALEGDTSDTGRQIRDVVTALRTHGVAREDLWPYDLDRLRLKPFDAVYADAATRLVIDAQVVPVSARGVRTALYLGHPVIVGVTLFRSFESDAVAADGQVPMPRWGESEVGRHAMVIGGNDQAAANQNRVRNSWGAEWGDGGDCHLSDDYLARYGNDFWAILTNLGEAA